MRGARGKSVDLNCDLGEGFGSYSVGDDEALMVYISSANIACGFHAGDPSVMRKTIGLALENGVSIGAHPGYPDLQGFGRRYLRMSVDELYSCVLYQVAALKGMVEAAGGRLRHVKPHGALYNAAAIDHELAGAIVRAVRDLDLGLAIVGLSNSELIKAARSLGLRALSEVFADRAYADEGGLVDRSRDGALIDNPDKAAQRALRMIEEGVVASIGGKAIAVVADTICVHGDGSRAALLARRIRETLEAGGIGVEAPE